MGALQSTRFSHASNDYELVIRSAKELEFILESKFGASGQSIHQKIDSLPANTLPDSLVKQMRFLATMRNKLVHERGFDSIPDRARFITQFEASVLELEKLVLARDPNTPNQICALQ